MIDFLCIGFLLVWFGCRHCIHSTSNRMLFVRLWFWLWTHLNFGQRFSGLTCVCVYTIVRLWNALYIVVILSFSLLHSFIVCSSGVDPTQREQREREKKKESCSQFVDVFCDCDFGNTCNYFLFLSNMMYAYDSSTC